MPEPDPKLLQKAVDDREAHPRRYYKLDHETMKRLLDQKAQEAASLRQKSAGQEQVILDMVYQRNELRQRLEEERAEFAVKLEQARMEPSGGYLHANAQADAHVLRIDRDSWRRVAERLENEKMQAQQQLRVITEQRDQLVPQLAQAQQERDEALDKLDAWESKAFDRILDLGRALLDKYYPASVFTGVSGDLGPTYVAALRDALKRKSQAEAALEEMQKQFDEFANWLKASWRMVKLNEVLAELQRRRSRPAEETK